MPDVVSPETRSRMMSGIRGRDTQPELVVRRFLHRQGFRFRLHVAGMPGRPDLVLARYRTAIFVHGCFWHRHPGCRYATLPATRREFWETKLEGNATRDARDTAALEAVGWRVIVVWECDVRRGEIGWLPDAIRRYGDGWARSVRRVADGDRQRGTPR